MIKRAILLLLFCGAVAGCRTVREPVEEEAVVLEIPEEVPASVTNAPAAEPEEPGEPPATNAPAELQAAATNAPPEEAPPPPVDTEQTIQQERNIVMILMKTTKGDIKLELDREKAPKTVDNFLGYVESGHYNGTIFHRVINGFMIQGGGFDESMNQKPAPRTVENEAKNGLKNLSGSIAMARTPDPHSASAQFFINVNDNGFLDFPGQDGWGYCVFGRVVEGMDVVNAIKDVPTAASGFHRDVPKEPVMITSVIVIEE